MKDFIANNGGLLESLGLLLVCFNIILGAAHQLLGKLKAMAAVDSVLVTVIGVIQKILDMVGGNVAHKDVPPAPKV